MNDTATILLFGGTFDPPTRAHAMLPPRAAELIGAAQLLYVPAAVSPHKLEQVPTPAEHRMAMLELALADVEDAQIRTMELDRDGPSYSVDTVRSLREEFDDGTVLRLLIGDDQAVAFHRWKDWKAIIDLAEPLVLPRGYDSPEGYADAMRACGGGWSDSEIEQWCRRRLNLPCMTMCSQEVRFQLESGGEADEELDPDVRKYIRAQGLYR